MLVRLPTLGLIRATARLSSRPRREGRCAGKSPETRRHSSQRFLFGSAGPLVQELRASDNAFNERVEAIAVRRQSPVQTIDQFLVSQDQAAPQGIGQELAG